MNAAEVDVRVEEISEDEEIISVGQAIPSLSNALEALSLLRRYCSSHLIDESNIAQLEEAIFQNRMKIVKQTKITDYIAHT